MVLFAIAAFTWFLLTPVLALASFNAVTSEAVLVDGGETFHAEFRDRGGQTIRAEIIDGAVASEQRNVADGDSITIKYDPGDPTLAWYADDVDQDKAWLYTLIMGAFPARLGIYWAWETSPPSPSKPMIEYGGG